MIVVNIAAFLICLFVLSYIWDKKPVEVLPVLTCILVLVLYALALLGHLSLIDIIAVVTIAAFLIYLVKCNKDQRADLGRHCLKNMTHVSTVTALALILFIVICTSQKVVTWWDDINFWATDVKSLYYLDGFASKYSNVAPEFGDYPPAAQLFKWWFLHFAPGNFNEGLAFAGYYTMNIIFMLPVLRKLKGKNPVIMILMALSIWFIPSVAEVYGYNGFCADLTLACVYGGFLFAVTDRGDFKDVPIEEDGKKQEKRKGCEYFYYMRLALYLGVLVLVKSVGFIWAAFGLVFFFLYQVSEKKTAIVWTPVVLPIITGGSWLLFCLVMRRVTRTTATAVKYITTDEYGLSGYMSDYAKAFLEAFVKLPLHQEKSALLNLSPLAFYICICLIVILFYHKGIMPKRQGRIILMFSVISGAVFYGIIFIAHITIFANETQYLEPAGMISSIERYGAPFTIGTLIFLANIWMEYGECILESKKLQLRIRESIFLHKYGTCLALILFVALTAGYKSGYYGLIGYRSDVEEQLAGRAAMIDEDAQTFLEVLQPFAIGSGIYPETRILYIQRDDTPRWVKNSYVNLEASPISVVYKSVNLNDAPADWMEAEIRASHAFYVYVESTDADAEEVFAGMMTEGDFSCEKLYRIEGDGVHLSLSELQ